MAPEVCPNCGEDVPRKARACPNCGADENTGWSEDAQSADLGVSEDSFDYNEFVENEFGGKKVIPRGIKPFAWAVALLLLVAFFIGILSRLF